MNTKLTFTLSRTALIRSAARFSTNVRRKPATSPNTSSRLTDLRNRLKDDEKDEAVFSSFIADQKSSKYDTDLFSDKGKSFLRAAEIFNIKYDRGGKNGEGYVGVREVLETTKVLGFCHQTKGKYLFCRRRLAKQGSVSRQRLKVR